MFDSVLLYFANLRRIKRCKACVSGLNALFLGTNVVMHPFYTIGPKMMFGCVSEYFANLQHVKDAKHLFESECTISEYQSCEASILDYWTQNDVLECFRAFRTFDVWKDTKLFLCLNALFRGTKVLKPSMCKKMQHFFCAWMHYFGVLKFSSVHSSLLCRKSCLRVFQ
jgi:hypothetical protein